MSDDQILILTREVADIGGTLKTQMHTLTELTKRHDEVFFGTPDRDGLITRSDRLEQRDARRSKHLWLIWGAIATAAMSRATSFFLGR